MSENITLFFVAIIIKNCQENPAACGGDELVK
jgi:hypothetical protein